MKHLVQKKSLVSKQFTFFWILFTLILLAGTLYLNWQISLAKSHQNLTQLASTLGGNTDRFVEDLFQEVYTLPVYEKNFSNCKKNLAIHLQRIILNVPSIAGLVVGNNQQLLCSTLEDTQGLYLSNTQNRALLGPFTLSVFDHPVYLIQQKMGNYYIGILVLSSTMKKLLSTEGVKTNNIAIYDALGKKIILQFSKSEEPLDHSGSKMFSSHPLYSLDRAHLVVFENKKTLFHYLKYREIMATLFLLSTSCLLYFLIKQLISRRYSLFGAMKLAIKNEEFYPVYQPLFDKEKNRYTGAEILLRWQPCQDEPIMPDLFIIEAETTGLIVPMTLQIIEIAFHQTQEILKNLPDFHLAFNISALHFTHPTFFDQFDVLLKKYALSPAQIMFEITERDLLDKNNDIFFNKMKTLRKEGFSLAVDDYGTGHASISYLHHFPFNYLKIDKLFIQSIGTKALTESLNEVIINMAKRLHLIIIAEGVETAEQVKYLSEHGVHFLQGWYFSKALSIEKLSALLQGDKHEPQS